MAITSLEIHKYTTNSRRTTLIVTKHGPLMVINEQFMLPVCVHGSIVSRKISMIDAAQVECPTTLEKETSTPRLCFY